MTKFLVTVGLLILSFVSSAGERPATYGPTTAEETIWSIAQKVHPDHALAVNQTIYALYQANPKAFLGKNINHLMRDMTLKIPSDSSIRTVDKKLASALIIEHQRAWETKSKQKSVAPQTTISSNSPSVIEQQVGTLGKQIETLSQTVTEAQETFASLAAPPSVQVSPPYFLGFKPFEWLLFTFLTLLTAALGWVCFSLNALRRGKQKREYAAECCSDEDPPIELPKMPPKKFQEREAPSLLKQLDIQEEPSTQLDLARAYLEMKEHEHAKPILQAVLKQGNAKEREEADKLLADIS